jgi:Na+-transporting NADH:ubiquinone oxidoreductase subunit C
MKEFSNKYIFLFALTIVVIVAVLLSVISINLQPRQEKNIEIEKKTSILAALHIPSNQKTAEAKYEEYITNSYVINHKGDIVSDTGAFYINFEKQLHKPEEKMRLPVFTGKNNKSMVYILPLFGKGLWGDIWGYIALKNDLNTIYGITFDHEKETPGLGSQITDHAFQQPFTGKKIFDPSGRFVSVKVDKKNVTPEAPHKVDAISGATITCDGVEEMIENCLKIYVPFLKANKKQNYAR